VELEQTSLFKEVREALSKSELHGMTHPSSGNTPVCRSGQLPAVELRWDELLVLAFSRGSVSYNKNFLTAFALVEKASRVFQKLHTH